MAHLCEEGDENEWDNESTGWGIDVCSTAVVSARCWLVSLVLVRSGGGSGADGCGGLIIISGSGGAVGGSAVGGREVIIINISWSDCGINVVSGRGVGNVGWRTGEEIVVTTHAVVEADVGWGSYVFALNWSLFGSIIERREVVGGWVGWSVEGGVVKLGWRLNVSSSAGVLSGSKGNECDGSEGDETGSLNHFCYMCEERKS